MSIYQFAPSSSEVPTCNLQIELQNIASAPRVTIYYVDEYGEVRINDEISGEEGLFRMTISRYSMIIFSLGSLTSYNKSDIVGLEEFDDHIFNFYIFYPTADNAYIHFEA